MRKRAGCRRSRDWGGDWADQLWLFLETFRGRARVSSGGGGGGGRGGRGRKRTERERKRDRRVNGQRNLLLRHRSPLCSSPARKRSLRKQGRSRIPQMGHFAVTAPPFLLLSRTPLPRAYVHSCKVSCPSHMTADLSPRSRPADWLGVRSNSPRVSTFVFSSSAPSCSTSSS